MIITGIPFRSESFFSFEQIRYPLWPGPRSTARTTKSGAVPRINSMHPLGSALSSAEKPAASNAAREALDTAESISTIKTFLDMNARDETGRFHGLISEGLGSKDATDTQCTPSMLQPTDDYRCTEAGRIKELGGCESLGLALLRLAPLSICRISASSRSVTSSYTISRSRQSATLYPLLLSSSRDGSGEAATSPFVSSKTKRPIRRGRDPG